MRKRSLRRQRRQRASEPRSPMRLIGVDLAEGRRPRHQGRWILYGLALVMAGGLLVALRMDIVRERYALMVALDREQALVEEQRDLTVELRRLRDPARLGARARELGFVRPSEVIDLGPAPAGPPAPTDGAEPVGPVLAARP